MPRLLKLLHILGLVLFLGSIPTHIILGQITPGGAIPDMGIVFSRKIMLIITLVATVPGLVLLTVTGWLRRRAVSAPRPSWLRLHLAIGLIILAVGTLVITPQVLELMAQAEVLATDSFDPAAWKRAKLIEDVAGTLNVVLALLAMGLACFRPTWK
jgi:hypothetical protein